MSNESFFFFYNGSFSQWHRCKFQHNSIHFSCAEQYMMYSKALLFQDNKSAQAILEAKTPREQKKLGREVHGFNEQVWALFREGIVLTGNYAKFSQNPELRSALLSTKDKLIVEASPRDKIWGIGLSKDDPEIHDQSNWRGLNLLGIALTRVREILLYEEKINNKKTHLS